MAQTFSLANTLGAGRQLKSNLESAVQNREFNSLRASGERQRQDIRQKEFNADQRRANSEKVIVGIDLLDKNLSLAPRVLDELVRSSILPAEAVPDMLAEAQNSPDTFRQKMLGFRDRLTFDLGQQPQFGAPQAGIDSEGKPIFGQIDPATGESRTVTGIQPSAASATTGRERFFGSLTEGLSLEDQELARRVQLGLEPRAVGSANITIAGDEELTEDVAESQATIAQRKKFGEATGALRSKLIDKGFESIKNIDVNLRNLDKAIVALNEGAKTGVIETKFFPTIRASTVKLEQIQSELGLDVVGGVTFGALSKGELDLALTVALPIGLQPPELLQWLQAKKTAQEKLRAYYAEQIDFLDKGGSVAGFLRALKRQSDPNQQQQNVIRFDAQGNPIG